MSTQAAFQTAFVATTAAATSALPIGAGSEIAREWFVGVGISALAGLARSAMPGNQINGYKPWSIAAEIVARVVVSAFVGSCFWWLLYDRADFGLRVALTGISGLFAVEVIEGLKGKVEGLTGWLVDRARK